MPARITTLLGRVFSKLPSAPAREKGMPPFRVPHISSPLAPPIAPIRARPALPPLPRKAEERKKTSAPNLRGGGGEGGGNFCHNTSSNKSNFSPSFLLSFSSSPPSFRYKLLPRMHHPPPPEEEYRWIRMGPRGEGGTGRKNGSPHVHI